MLLDDALELARQMGVDFGYNAAATAVFKAIGDAVPAYSGLRYPNLKDESRPVQVKHALKVNPDTASFKAALTKSVDQLPSEGDKITVTPKIGHKLHRLTTMTSKTAQFHLLAHGNPKPENLLVAPLVQFELDGTPKVSELAEAAAVGVGDRE